MWYMLLYALLKEWEKGWKIPNIVRNAWVRLLRTTECPRNYNGTLKLNNSLIIIRMK